MVMVLPAYMYSVSLYTDLEVDLPASELSSDRIHLGTQTTGRWLCLAEDKTKKAMNGGNDFFQKILLLSKI